MNRSQWWIFALNPGSRICKCTNKIPLQKLWATIVPSQYQILLAFNPVYITVSSRVFSIAFSSLQLSFPLYIYTSYLVFNPPNAHPPLSLSLSLSPSLSLLWWCKTILPHRDILIVYALIHFYTLSTSTVQFSWLRKPIMFILYIEAI